MTKPTSKPPLWRVMHRAHEQESGSVIDHLGNIVLGEPDHFTRAAEIRALADWLVPEESSEPFLPGEDSHNRSKRQQRRHLRRTLMEEAAKAEAGT